MKISGGVIIMSGLCVVDMLLMILLAHKLVYYLNFPSIVEVTLMIIFNLPVLYFYWKGVFMNSVTVVDKRTYYRQIRY